MSDQVLSDPQFGIVRILRPFEGFEDVYTGQPATRPIMLTEGGQALDQRAGQEGYDAQLVRGIETPMGSKVRLWIPTVFYVESIEPTTLQRYTWTLLWRYRNTRDYRLDRKPWHFPKQGPGAPDTSGGSSAPRVVVPCANSTVLYTQSEPGTVNGRAVQNVYSEDLVVGGGSPSLPLNPSGAIGAFQQGVADPAGPITAASGALYQSVEVEAQGDEMLLAVFRSATPPTWAFNSAALFPASSDAQLSTLFAGGDNVGVYVSVGVSSP